MAINGITEPVLWLGDGVHDAKAENAFALAEVISLKSINFKRQVPPGVSAGQFNAGMIGQSGCTARFYKVVTAISGVKLVAEKVSSAKLILNLQAVATISGTVALEAAILADAVTAALAPGKPVVYFVQKRFKTDQSNGQEMTQSFIPYGRQNITDEDIDAVVASLRSDYLTQGPQVPAFERKLADMTGAAHAVALNSATSALHVACMALDLGAGDWLWTVPNTFVASANCALYCGAQVDFVDIDPVTYTMCPDALEAKLKQADAAGKLPKIIVPVHLCGQSCDMEAISRIARSFGVKIVEDASHSIGAHHQGQPVGDCRYSEITVFSFHPVKIITTAEGGMATTQDASLARKMDLARSHGITRDPDEMTHAPDGPWYYQQISLGYNYRMTELQGALGLSQLKQLHTFVARRRQLAAQYDDLLSDLPLMRPAQHPDSNSTWHLYVVRVAADRHTAVFEALRAAGIGVNLHYIPVHTQPYYQAMGFAPGQFPEAESYYAEAISIPLYAGLSDADQERVVQELRNALADQ